MCGRYTPLTEDEIVEVRDIIQSISLKLAKDELAGYETTFAEVAPTNRSPVVISDGRELTFEHAQFGFEKWDGKGVIINARCETIHEKPMFKEHINTGRCVVPASGYYEWKREGQTRKLKHLIKDRHGNLLFMAGLWRDGKTGREFVIITKDPVGEILDIHDRMPVVLKTDQIESWLSGTMPIEVLAKLDYDCTGEPCSGSPPSKDGGLEQLTLF